MTHYARTYKILINVILNSIQNPGRVLFEKEYLYPFGMSGFIAFLGNHFLINFKKRNLVNLVDTKLLVRRVCLFNARTET